MKTILLLPPLALMLAACSNAPVQKPGSGHLAAPAAKVGAGGTATIPAPVQQIVALPRPQPAPKVETYSVVVNNVRVQELLFALARDAKLNVDIHPGIEGLVTLNAIDQTLQQLLTRIAKQVDIRWELDGPNLSVMPDKPFLRTYQIDFPNMTRMVKSEVSTATQIASAAAGQGGSPPGGGAAGGNVASTNIKSETKNDLMESLIGNVTNMLKEEDRIRWRQRVETNMEMQVAAQGDGQAALSGGARARNPDGAAVATGPGVAGSGNQQVDGRRAAEEKVGVYEPAVSVFANKESGVLIVRATARQHEKIQRFIDQVMGAAKRQVLIEATIVEVNLNNDYKQGIDWSALRTGETGFQIRQQAGGALPSANPLSIFTLAYANPTLRQGSLAMSISLLESFGNVKVLSSPKLSVMNNQTATLKVAEDEVYFTVKADTTNTSSGLSQTTYTSTPHSVTVGFIMNVTPQISEGDEVTINIRPTITRVTGYVNDPNPALTGVLNRVPRIQTREMESIIKINSGEIAVMGGLMQEEMRNLTDAVPGLGSLPVIGNFFRHNNDRNNKTELVIFLRPIVIKDASVAGDFAPFRSHLPDADFFGRGNVGPPTQRLDFGSARE